MHFSMFHIAGARVSPSSPHLVSSVRRSKEEFYGNTNTLGDFMKDVLRCEALFLSCL